MVLLFGKILWGFSSQCLITPIYGQVKEIVRGVLLMDGAEDVGEIREVVAWFGVAA